MGTPVDDLRFALYGSPPSPAYQPSREGVINAFAAIYAQVIATQAASTGGYLAFATVALMNANTTQTDGKLAYVYKNNGNISDAANKFYQWNAATSAWVAATGIYNSFGTAVTDEATARNAADLTITGNLNAEITARTNAVATLTTNLANEIAARTTGDSGFTSAITTESNARLAADNAEAATRAAADSAETTARINADTTEATARAAADTVLTNSVAAALSAVTVPLTTTPGSGATYATTSSVALPAPGVGTIVAWTPDRDSIASPMISINGLTARNLRTSDNQSPPAGFFRANVPYILVRVANAWFVFNKPLVTDYFGRINYGTTVHVNVDQTSQFPYIAVDKYGAVFGCIKPDGARLFSGIEGQFNELKIGAQVSLNSISSSAYVYAAVDKWGAVFRVLDTDGVYRDGATTNSANLTDREIYMSANTGGFGALVDSSDVIYMFLVFGQSLARGANDLDSADPPVTTTPVDSAYALMFDSGVRPTGAAVASFAPLVETSSSASQETVCSGLAAQFIKSINDITAKKPTVLMAIAASSQQIYEHLKRGGVSDVNDSLSLPNRSVYAEGLRLIQEAVRIATAADKRVIVNGVWIQGEANFGDGVTSQSLYRAFLSQLQAHMDADVKRVNTAQFEPFRLFVECQNRSSTTLGADNAVSLAQAHNWTGNDVVIPLGPHYDQPMSGGVHKSSLGYRRIGERQGRQIAGRLGGLPAGALIATGGWWTDAARASVRCNVPVGSLVIDTSGVVSGTGLGGPAAGVTGGVGVDFTDGSPSPPTVTNVVVIAPDILDITLSRPPGRATAAINISALAVAGDTLTIGGVTFTYTNVGGATTPLQIDRGASAAACRTNTAAAINAYAPLPLSAIVSGTSINLTAAFSGAQGNFAMAATWGTPANISIVGAATVTGNGTATAMTGGSNLATNPRLFFATRSTGVNDGPTTGARSLVRDSEAAVAIYDGSQLRNWLAPSIVSLPPAH